MRIIRFRIRVDHYIFGINHTRRLYDSALAQLVEQMTVNHWVAGSSPAGGAIISRLKFYIR